MRTAAPMIFALALASGCTNQEARFALLDIGCRELTHNESLKHQPKAIDFFLREVGTEVRNVRIGIGQQCENSIIFQIDAYVVEMDTLARWLIHESQPDNKMWIQRPE